MCATLMVHRPGDPPEEVALGGPITAGGGPSDAVRIEAPPRAVALAPSPGGVLVEALVAAAVLGPGERAARPLPPGRRRLLRPGDSLRVAGAVLEVPPGAPVADTRLLAGRLLGEAGRGDPPSAGPHLLALEGPDAGRRLPIAVEATLGRGRGATLRLGDAGASRRHARVARAGAGFTLEDLGSKNGLRLNGSPVGRGAVALRPGDEIACGQTVLAMVLPADGPPGPALSPAEAGRAAPGAAARPSRPLAALAAAALLAGAAALAAAALRA